VEQPPIPEDERDVAAGAELAEHFRPNPSLSDNVQMRRLLSCLIAAALPLAAAAQSRIPSLEQEGRRGDVGRAAQQKAVERFDSADADKDGRLSRAEVSARFEYMTENFDRMDRNGDGALDWNEFIGHDRWKKE
jgi:EF hand domain-containing protein